MFFWCVVAMTIARYGSDVKLLQRIMAIGLGESDAWPLLEQQTLDA